MRRKGDAEIQILALLLFIASVAQWAYMIGAPQQFEEAITRQANDAESLVKTGTIRAHMEEEYVPNSLTDAAYQGMYAKGKDGFGPWNPDSIPSWDEIKGQFESSVNDQLQNNYIGAVGTGAGCSMNGNDQVSMEIDGEQLGDPPIMTYAIANPAPLHVECQATAQATDFGGGRSSFVKERIAVPDTRDVERMRYKDMHSVARDIATSNGFQRLLNTAEKSATIATKTGCSKRTEEECGWNPPSVSFSDDDAVENQAEESVGTRLASELHSRFQNAYADRGYEVTFAVREVEFTPKSVTQVQDIEWVVQCLQNDYASWTEYPSGDGCGGDCPPDTGSCPARIDDGAQCTSDCSPASSKPTSDPGPPLDSGSNLWTDNPWSSGCGASQNDPYTFDGISNVAFRQAGMRQLNEYTRSGPAGPGGDTCTPSCPADQESCYENLGSESNARGSWQFDLESHTVVTVTINDTENRIPTSAGFSYPLYRFTFEQRVTQSARSFS